MERKKGTKRTRKSRKVGKEEEQGIEGRTKAEGEKIGGEWKERETTRRVQRKEWRKRNGSKKRKRIRGE